MTLAEFKAWLEGYSASFKDGAPNAEQWAEIKRRLDAALRPYSAVEPWLPGAGNPITVPFYTVCGAI